MFSGVRLFWVTTTQVLEGKTIGAFLMGFEADGAKETLPKKLKHFLSSCNMTPGQFIDVTRSNPKEAEGLAISPLMVLTDRGSLAYIFSALVGKTR